MRARVALLKQGQQPMRGTLGGCAPAGTPGTSAGRAPAAWPAAPGRPGGRRSARQCAALAPPWSAWATVETWGCDCYHRLPKCCDLVRRASTTWSAWAGRQKGGLSLLQPIASILHYGAPRQHNLGQPGRHINGGAVVVTGCQHLILLPVAQGVASLLCAYLCLSTPLACHRHARQFRYPHRRR